MEQMPYRQEMELEVIATPVAEVASSDWRAQLPVLEGRRVVLRDLRTSDAASLHALLTREEVTRFISPPPSTVEGFEKFIAWTHRQRAAGEYVCFAVTVEGFDTAIGIFQVRKLGADWETAEWGFAIGSPFWGTGVFSNGAELVLDFVFDTLGVRRLEARAAIRNGRGTGALLKTGAVLEAVLRHSFKKDGAYVDQGLYTILADDWRASRDAREERAAAYRVH